MIAAIALHDALGSWMLVSLLLTMPEKTDTLTVYEGAVTGAS
jgi:hypothetical protein